MAATIDQLDERLIHDRSVRTIIRTVLDRLRSGELGMVSVLGGLAIIWIGFYLQQERFLSSRNLVRITLDAAPLAVISVGVVLVMLLGEIDLSIGSVSGLSGAVLMVHLVNDGWQLKYAIALCLVVSLLVGAFYGLWFTRFGVPSFVVTLSGLMIFLGLQLRTLGEAGTINLHDSSLLWKFANSAFLADWLSYAVVVAAGVSMFLARVLRQRRRRQAGLSSGSMIRLAILTLIGVAAGLGGVAYLNQAEGVGLMPLSVLIGALVVDWMLTRTASGRHVFAVGGSEEAARRSGISVNRIYVGLFALCSMMAGVGGILAVGRLAAANQASGGGTDNLVAISAAVIGGTSLFGGRGSALSALLGMVVLKSIDSGLNLVEVDSDVRFMVYGGVLLLAATVDSFARQARKSSGRG